MTAAVLLPAVAALALAGFVQGLTGFGFGLVAMALLPAVLGLDQAQAVATVMGLVTVAAMTGMTLRDVRWSSVGPLALGSAAGVPLGFMSLAALPQAVVVRLLGLAICLLVLFEGTPRRGGAVRLPGRAAWWVGVASGTLNGAFNIGGPPLVAYIYGQPWPKEQQAATLSGAILASAVLRLVLLLASQRSMAATWTSAAWGVGPMLAALVCGIRLLNSVSQKHLRVGISVALLALGGRYLIAGA
jgi:uncharacterized membrane protein YfcA